MTGEAVARENPTLLSAHKLGKTFSTSKGDVIAFANLNFEVEVGEFICVVGSSGCGKSTLLAMVAGLLPISEGDLLLSGEAIVAAGPDRGMVFQSDALYPWLTVQQNAELGLGFKVNRRDRETVAHKRDFAEQLLDTVGLARFKHVYPKQLSGGMRQRVALVRALINRPSILLMDEPFGALDAQTREEMQALLLGICAESKITVLFITHDVEEAVYLADRVLVMRGQPGELVGEVKVTLARPRASSIRLGPRFNALRGDVLNLLYDAKPEQVGNAALNATA